MLTSAIQSSRQMIPSQEQVTGKFSTLIPKVSINLNKAALLAFAIFALASFPGADAGPVSYGVCVAACLALATPVAMPACLVGCIGLSGPWCP